MTWKHMSRWWCCILFTVVNNEKINGELRIIVGKEGEFFFSVHW